MHRMRPSVRPKQKSSGTWASDLPSNIPGHQSLGYPCIRVARDKAVNRKVIEFCTHSSTQL